MITLAEDDTGIDTEADDGMNIEVSAVYRLFVPALAFLLRSLSNMGQQAPAHKAFSRELRAEPMPGDLVIESSTLGISVSPLAIGKFERKVKEPVDGWDAAENGEPAPLDTFYYIRRLDNGEIVRWNDCEFFRLPRNVNEACRWLHPQPADEV